MRWWGQGHRRGLAQGHQLRGRGGMESKYPDRPPHLGECLTALCRTHPPVSGTELSTSQGKSPNPTRVPTAKPARRTPHTDPRPSGPGHRRVLQLLGKGAGRRATRRSRLGVVRTQQHSRVPSPLTRLGQAAPASVWSPSLSGCRCCLFPSHAPGEGVGAQ